MIIACNVFLYRQMFQGTFKVFISKITGDPISIFWKMDKHNVVKRLSFCSGTVYNRD